MTTTKPKSSLDDAALCRLRRDAQPTELAAGFGNHSLAHRNRPETAVLQLRPQPGEEHLAPEAETLLMFAARRIHVDNLIRPALERGEWVLCDRYTDATRAYQGGGRGVPADFIESLARIVHADVEPDLTLLLDLPPALGLARAAARRGAKDRFESENSAFFGRVRASYLEIARTERRVVVIDASRPLVEVVAASLAAVEGRAPT